MMTTGAAIKVLPSSGQPPVTGRRRCPATFMEPFTASTSTPMRINLSQVRSETRPLRRHWGRR
jgi:hypothetical protein